MVITQKVAFPQWAKLYVLLFNKLHGTTIDVNSESADIENMLAFEFNDTPYLLYYLFTYELGWIQKEAVLNSSFELSKDAYLMRGDRAADLTSNKLTMQVAAEIAVVQVVYKFNLAHGTEVAVSDYILDGCPFVTFDFNNTSKEMLFNLGYQVGLTQAELAASKEYVDMLPLKDYPLPPEWGETGYESPTTLGENYYL